MAALCGPQCSFRPGMEVFRLPSKAALTGGERRTLPTLGLMECLQRHGNLCGLKGTPPRSSPPIPTPPVVSFAQGCSCAGDLFHLQLPSKTSAGVSWDPPPTPASALNAIWRRGRWESSGVLNGCGGVVLMGKGTIIEIATRKGDWRLHYSRGKRNSEWRVADVW